MALKIFEFIEESIEVLEEERDYLEGIRDELEGYFEHILKGSCEGYININSRVKSKDSLKEKILRNNYYKKSIEARELIYNLSDLIGIRVECRFIKDEDEIFDLIKSYFTNGKVIGKVSLDLIGEQPQKQKNGFKIYRIDGYYKDEDLIIPFELQIKSLVNIFWSEIEHKIIYKNNSYMLIDNYLKDIMKSIKKNLMMIDHQLLVTYNQFNSQNVDNQITEKSQLEKLLSKIIYDAYALKMKNSMGFVVDFKKPCDTIMRYFLRGDDDDYSKKLIKTLGRLNEIHEVKTEFEEEIQFERDLIFKTDFSHKIGHRLLESINTEFQWNLFFRIIFEIEPGNNAEDFENFIEFYSNIFMSNLERKNIPQECREDILNVIVRAFINLNSIEFIIEEKIEEINNVIEAELLKFNSNGDNYNKWIAQKEIHLELLYIRLIAIFDGYVETNIAMELIDNIHEISNLFKINPLVYKYINKLSTFKKIKARDIVKYIIV